MLTALFMIVLQISVASGIMIFSLTIFSSKLNKIFTAKWKFWVWLLLTTRLLIPINFTVSQAPILLPISDAPIFSATERQTSQMPEYFADTQSLTMIEFAALIWLIGLILFLLYHMIVYSICKRRIFRWSHAPGDVALLSALNDMRFEMGVCKNIQLLINPKISSPMIIGIFNSCLLLPTEDYTPLELHYIIKHELIHIKRRDVWYKLLLLCANAVHWFNPLIYLMLNEAGKDLELACDEEVVKGLTFDDRKEYSDTILKSVCRRSLGGMMPTVCFYSGANVIKARFRNILNKSEKRNGTFFGVIVIFCAFVMGTLIACDSSGFSPITSAQSALEYYHITSDLEEFPVDDIFFSLSEADIKTTAARYIEDIALQNGLALPDYFDQYFFIRKLKDENELEQLKERGLESNRSQIHTIVNAL